MFPIGDNSLPGAPTPRESFPRSRRRRAGIPIALQPCMRTYLGDPVMPVWHEQFRAEAGWGMGRRVEVQGKLLLITDYVRSLQAGEKAPHAAR